MRIGTILAAAVVVMCSVSACGGPLESPSPSLGSPSIIESPGAPVSSDGRTMVVDEALLDVLPAQVDGIDLVGDPDTAAGIASDPDLGPIASAIAVALAIEPGASLGDDLAVVSVVQLRPGVYDETWFRSWRDTYDTAACEPAGGVTGNAQADIGGHDTYIGSCAQGAFTYHTYLVDLDRVVSVTSVGERRLGEQVVAGLGE